MLKSQIVQNEAVKPMILPEPARPIARRHEEGGPCMIKLRILDQLHHIACGQDTGITLLAGGQLPSPVKGLFIRFRKDIGFHPTGLESSSHSKGMVTHIRDINLFGAVGDRFFSLGGKSLSGLDIFQAVQKSLASCNGTGIGAVFIDLQLEVRFSF